MSRRAHLVGGYGPRDLGVEKFRDRSVETTTRSARTRENVSRLFGYFVFFYTSDRIIPVWSTDRFVSSKLSSRVLCSWNRRRRIMSLPRFFASFRVKTAFLSWVKCDRVFYEDTGETRQYTYFLSFLKRVCTCLGARTILFSSQGWSSGKGVTKSGRENRTLADFFNVYEKRPKHIYYNRKEYYSTTIDASADLYSCSKKKILRFWLID